MDNALEYKGYIGSVQYSAADEVFYGKIEAINDLITFEADNAKQLKHEFEASVEDYLEFCQEEGKTPEKTFKGVFNVRVGEALHRRAALAAVSKGMKLNELVTKAISHYVEEPNYRESGSRELELA
jgi:predicted HicB family RNase H-like nuclease